MTTTVEARAITAKQIISERARATDDERFVLAVAEYLTRSPELLAEVRANPELLIEMIFTIVDKNKKTVPFFLNDVQRDFVKILNEHKGKFARGEISSLLFLILKGRQQGFTSFMTSYQLACSILNLNFEGLTLADNSANAEVIFDNKAKTVLDRLPERIVPTIKYNNRRELRFNRLNSFWQCSVATKNVGRSRTLNFLHASEAAFWAVPIAELQEGLNEALTANSIKIYESTANGFNDYHAMWQSGAHINCFFEWWRTKEYRIEFSGEDLKRDFLKLVETGEDWIFERCRWLLDKKKLVPEQVFWYYDKFSGYIDKDQIKQAYPCYPEEAFLSSGRPVFNIEKIAARIEELSKKKFETISFAPRYKDPESRDVILDFEVLSGGVCEVYQRPVSNVKYVVGADTSGEGSDFYTAFVLRNDTGAQVASVAIDLRSADCAPFVEILYCLGKYYNDALVAPEINFNYQVVSELARLRYPKIYVRQRYENFTKDLTKQFGWKTDGNTRPMIISLFGEVIENSINLINDVEMLRECLSFEFDEKGKADARSGYHDDRIFAAMIAHKAREQQSYYSAKEKKYIKCSKDIVSDYRKAKRAEKDLIEKRLGGIPIV